jgi:hypothetical protein
LHTGGGAHTAVGLEECLGTAARLRIEAWLYRLKIRVST